MEFKNCAAYKFLGLLIFLCISRVCHGQLMCYVCDNCDQTTAETPQFECNENFFNIGGVTETSIQTTTEPAKTTAGVTEDNDVTTTEVITHTSPTNSTEEEAMTTTTTTTMKTITDSKSPETTTKATTTTTNALETTAEMTTEAAAEITTTQESVTTYGKANTTENSTLSSTTVDLVKTTILAPTSSNSSTFKPLNDVETLNNKTMTQDQHVNKDEVEDVNVEDGTTKAYKPSAEFRIRQLRSVSDVTFHCFKVHATTTNGTMVVNRGCSRIQANESVCEQWKSQHSNEKMNKCLPCSRTKCNGSSALNVSVTAFILVVVAVFMQRK